MEKLRTTREIKVFIALIINIFLFTLWEYWATKYGNNIFDYFTSIPQYGIQFTEVDNRMLSRANYDPFVGPNSTFVASNGDSIHVNRIMAYTDESPALVKVLANDNQYYYIEVSYIEGEKWNTTRILTNIDEKNYSWYNLSEIPFLFRPRSSGFLHILIIIINLFYLILLILRRCILIIYHFLKTLW